MLIATFGFMVGLLATLFVLVCVFMTLIILIQKPKGGGLAGAFGGAGGSSSAVFGAKTGDVLTWFTVGCFLTFLLLGMGLVWTVRSDATSHLREAPAITQPAGQPMDPAAFPSAPPLPGEQPITPGPVDPSAPQP